MTKASFFHNLSNSLSDYGKAMTFIGRHRLGIYFLYPLILNIALFSFGILAVGALSDMATNWAIEIIGGWFPSLANELNQFIYWFLWVVFKILYFIAFALISGSVILALLSPVFAFLSERVEKLSTGADYPFIFRKFVKEAIRGLMLAIRNGVLQTIAMIVLFFIGLIPFIGLAAPFLLLLVAAYFYGFSFMDYYNERRGYNIGTSVRYMQQNRATAVGNGLPYALLLLIPLVGGLIASFFSIVSVVAGTLTMIRKHQQA